MGGVVFTYFHHLFALLLSFPFVVDGIRSEGLGGWKGGKLGLGCLPQCVSPRLGLQQLLEGCPWLMLYPHVIWYVDSFLVMTNLGGEKLVEVTSWDFWGLRLVEDLVIVL